MILVYICSKSCSVCTCNCFYQWISHMSKTLGNTSLCFMQCCNLKLKGAAKKKRSKINLQVQKHNVYFPCSGNTIILRRTISWLDCRTTDVVPFPRFVSLYGLTLIQLSSFICDIVTVIFSFFLGLFKVPFILFCKIPPR